MKTVLHFAACLAVLTGSLPAVASPLFPETMGPACDRPTPWRGNEVLSGSFDRPHYQRVVQYCFDRDGMFTAVLDDGTVWRQWSFDVRYAYWRSPPADYRVLLRGDDQNGILVIENDGLGYKVRRIG